MKLLVIDNYDSFTFNLVQLIEQAGFVDFMIVKNDKLKSLEDDSFHKVIISPGPGIANEAGDLLWFLEKYHRIKPILGICLGHEAIAEFFGASLIQLDAPLHGIQNIGYIEKEDQIFKGLPNSFSIGHYHSWNIDESSLPDTLEVLVRDETGLNMAIRHTNLPITGLQFHPESIMTEFGLEMIKNWAADR